MNGRLPAALILTQVLTQVLAQVLAPLLALLLAVQAAAAAPLEVVYPPTQSFSDDRNDYPLKVLRLALSKAGVDVHMHQDSREMTQERALHQLARNDRLTVFWSMTTAARETDLRPIRIPIVKGLLGWRLLMIRDDDAPRFAAVQNLADLARLTAGQGHDWPDTAVLDHNGLRITPVPSYEPLFQMLAAGRYDYVPRSISEIFDEVRTYSDLHLMVEPTLVLHYPAAEYFFVNKSNDALAQAIETGLNKAIEDGSFDSLFHQEQGVAIARARLEQRRCLSLDNPDLPRQTPLDRRALWFQAPCSSSVPSPEVP